MRKKKKLATYTDKIDTKGQDHFHTQIYTATEVLKDMNKKAGVEYNKEDLGIHPKEEIQKGHIFTLDQMSMNNARTMTLPEFKHANLDPFQLDYINSLRKKIDELEQDKATMRKMVHDLRKEVDEIRHQLRVDQKMANK
jgi:DNA-binding SARP family transcriptional activator